MEEWKAIKGYEGKYLVSDQGRVMNAHGHISKTHINGHGCLSVLIGGKEQKVASLVAYAFIPNPYNHFTSQSYKDGNKYNCRANNLEWCSPNNTYTNAKKPVVLIKDGVVTVMESYKAATRFLNCHDGSIANAINRTDRICYVKGYAIASADDSERIAHITAKQQESVPDLPGEEWKPFPDNADYYISNKARVKSMRGAIPRLLKTTIQKSGYAYISTMNDGKVKLYRLHRVVAMAFIPNPNNLPEINHIDANKLNNDASNLEWCTREYNLADEHKRRRECSTV